MKDTDKRFKDSKIYSIKKTRWQINKLTRKVNNEVGAIHIKFFTKEYYSKNCCKM